MTVPQSVVDDSLRPASPILIPPLPAALYAELPPHSDCPPFILRKDEHALGVAFWAVPLLMRHASALFKALRRDTPQHSVAVDESSADPLLQCTRTLLLVNADNATAWNARKRRIVQLHNRRTAAVQSDATQPLLAELRLLSFLFSKHPKSSEAWAHRRWTAQRLLGATDSRGAELELARSELGVVEMCAERYPKNYHAWLYRQWIVAAVDERQRQKRCEVETEAEEGGSVPRWMEVLEGERRRIGAWNESHMSDHSGWHYRSFVVDRMLAASSAPPSSPSQRSSQLLSAELAYLSALQQSYPAHESAWSYRRYLLHAAVLRSGLEAELWREAEERWCDEREAALGQCSSDDEWRLERRYARVHRLYVTELVARAQQRRVAAGEKEALTMDDVLRGMEPHDRARWKSDVASVQQVYPRQVWTDRAALVT